VQVCTRGEKQARSAMFAVYVRTSVTRRHARAQAQRRLVLTAMMPRCFRAEVPRRRI